MIHATSLRLGNLILEAGEIKKVYQLSIGAKTYDSINDIKVNRETGLTESGEDRFEPVPLTPDWLFKLGGQPKGGWYGLFAKSTVWDEEVSIVFELMPPNTLTVYCNDQRLLLSTLPSVHQLQNLYFALTGEELTIKEKV